MKIDLHTHTCYSEDACLPVKDLIALAKSRVDGIAITDHNEVKGALEAMGSDFFVIPGIEVSSAGGHILGLGVMEKVEKNLSVDETIDRIRALGGIAIAPHPYKLGSGVKHGLEKFDAIETFNSRCMSNHKAARIAKKLNLPCTAGSDCHARDVGYAYTEFEINTTSIDDILEEIRAGKTKVHGKISPWLVWQSIKNFYLWAKRGRRI